MKHNFLLWVLIFSGVISTQWSNMSSAAEYDPFAKYQLAQTFSNQDIRKKMDEVRAHHQSRVSGYGMDAERRARVERMHKHHQSNPNLQVGETIHWSKSGKPLNVEKKWTSGSPDITVNQSDYHVALYPGNVRYTSEGTSTNPSGSSKENYMKFLTKDDVSQVYRFYVNTLKKGGWRFLKGSTTSEIQAALPGKHLAVSVKYKALSAPYKGTAVALTQAWRKDAGTPSRLVTLTTLDTNDRILKRWASGK